jgi:hypothetical protein
MIIRGWATVLAIKGYSNHQLGRQFPQIGDHQIGRKLYLIGDHLMGRQVSLIGDQPIGRQFLQVGDHQSGINSYRLVIIRRASVLTGW